MSRSKFHSLMIAFALLAAGPLPAARAQVNAPQFAQHELDSLVAPIALYPDNLLADVLMAATYPIEVVAAVRWLNQPGNEHMTGEDLMQVLDRETWDPSVKALTAVPQVLRMMDSRLDWMERLGSAFIADQAQVMDAVQRLRRQARANGSLRTDSTHRVIERDGAIIIEPSSSQALSVEVYEPMTVYGTWLYPEYPPVYIAPPPDYLVPVYTVPLIVPLWGWSSWDWRRHRINLDVPRWRDLDRHRSHVVIDNRWEHDPGRGRERRGGVLPGARPPTASLTPTPPVAPPVLTPGDPRRGGGRFSPPASSAPPTSPGAGQPAVVPPVGAEPSFGRRGRDDDGRLNAPGRGQRDPNRSPGLPARTPGIHSPAVPVTAAPAASPLLANPPGSSIAGTQATPAIPATPRAPGTTPNPVSPPPGFRGAPGLPRPATAPLVSPAPGAITPRVPPVITAPTPRPPAPSIPSAAPSTTPLPPAITPRIPAQPTAPAASATVQPRACAPDGRCAPP